MRALPEEPSRSCSSRARERWRALHQRSTSPRATGDRRGDRDAARLPHQSARPAHESLLRQPGLRVGRMRRERFVTSVLRPLQNEGEVRPPEQRLRTDHPIARVRLLWEPGNGRRHPCARSDSMSCATDIISARSSASASRAATSAASSLPRRNRRADPTSADRIASDRLMPAASNVRKACTASSSSRTEIASATHPVYHVT